MNAIPSRSCSAMGGVVPVRGGDARAWPRWAPYAAVVWSQIYAALGLFWATGGGGFPYAAQFAPGGVGALVGRLGTGGTWGIVVLLGIPAAALGAAMLRGWRGALRTVFIIAGVLIAAVLLLFPAPLVWLWSLGPLLEARTAGAYLAFLVVGSVYGWALVLTMVGVVREGKTAATSQAATALD